MPTLAETIQAIKDRLGVLDAQAKDIDAERAALKRMLAAAEKGADLPLPAPIFITLPCPAPHYPPVPVHPAPDPIWAPWLDLTRVTCVGIAPIDDPPVVFQYPSDGAIHEYCASDLVS